MPLLGKIGTMRKPALPNDNNCDFFKAERVQKLK